MSAERLHEESSLAHRARSNTPHSVWLHGAKPVVFLDGDKRNDKQVSELQTKCPDVTVITLPENQEFEDLVPPEVYIRAYHEVAEHDDLTWDNFQEWCGERNFSAKVMFSKRVELWAATKEDVSLPSKPLVMQRALELTDHIQDLPIQPIRELMDAIRTILRGL